VEAALEQISQAIAEDPRFALIITDCHMPDQDGFTLIEKVRQGAAASETPIVMLTSGAQKGDLTRCQRLGLAAYLTKPVQQRQLLLTLLRVLLNRPAPVSVPSYFPT